MAWEEALLQAARVASQAMATERKANLAKLHTYIAPSEIIVTYHQKASLCRRARPRPLPANGVLGAARRHLPSATSAHLVNNVLRHQLYSSALTVLSAETSAIVTEAVLINQIIEIAAMSARNNGAYQSRPVFDRHERPVLCCRGKVARVVGALMRNARPSPCAARTHRMALALSRIGISSSAVS